MLLGQSPPGLHACTARMAAIICTPIKARGKGVSCTGALPPEVCISYGPGQLTASREGGSSLPMRSCERPSSDRPVLQGRHSTSVHRISKPFLSPKTPMFVALSAPSTHCRPASETSAWTEQLIGGWKLAESVGP